MSMALHDITDVAGPTEHNPGFREGLEQLGWQVLGRVRLGTPEQIEATIKRFDPDVAPDLLEKELVGATVMRDHEGTTFAFLDWFGACPSIELMTVLADGGLVETQQAWSADPLLPSGREGARLFMSRQREQRRLESRGRSVQLVQDPSPAQLVDAHRQHVDRVAARNGVRPVEHGSLEHAMAVRTQQHQHASRSAGRVAVVTGLLTAAALFPGCRAMSDHLAAEAAEARLPWPFFLLSFLLVMTGTVALVWFVGLRLFTPVFYVRWLKPRCRMLGG